MSNDVESVLDAVRTVAAVPVDDGLVFDSAGATADSIREADIYTGVRVSLTGELSAARLAFHVDVNVGDPVWPPPQTVALPRLLDGEIAIAGYPLPMVHAEKLVTAVQRGVANTRWRDFADIYVLARRHDVDGNDLSAAIRRVAQHRGVRLVPLREVLDGYADLAQRRWAAWRRKQRLDDRLPEQFGEVLDTAITFADPAMTGTAIARTWSGADRIWRPGT